MLVRWLVLVTALVSLATANTNVLVLLANNVRTDDLSCYNPEAPVTTPNIDRLARDGVLMGHHTVPALTLTGNRAAHLSGRLPMRYGLQDSRSGAGRILHALSRAGLPPDVTTYAEVLRHAGYRTMAAGSWELGWGCESWADACHSPLQHGFQSFSGPLLSLVPPERELTSAERSQQRQLSDLLKATLGPPRYADIYRRLAETAWFQWLAGAAARQENTTAQTPLSEELQKQLEYILVSDESVTRWPYSLRGLTLPILADSLQFIRDSKRAGKPFLLQHTFLQVHSPSITAPHRVAASQQNNSQLLGAAADYYDSVLELDWAVGRLLDQLQQLGMLDNTLVYFSADHNDLMPVVGAGTTDNTVPGLMMLKNVVKPYVVQRPTSVLDIFPTIVDVIGKGPDLLGMDLDGSSQFFRLLTQGQPAPRRLFTYRGDAPESVTLMLPDDGESIYKVYISESCQLCREETKIFNLTADPFQRRPIGKQHPVFSQLLEDVRDNLFLVESVPSQLADFWQLAPLPEIYPWSQASLYDPSVNVSGAHDLFSFLEAEVVVAAETGSGSGPAAHRLDPELAAFYRRARDDELII